MDYIKITLKPGKEDSFHRFHPWVFSGAIYRFEKQPEEGDIVEVTDHQGNFIGIGQYQIGSIAVRILTFKPEEINEQFYFKRLQEAYNVRLSLGLLNGEYNNTCRLVHGEGDNLPGLIIDLYNKTAVMQAHTPGMHYARHQIAQALKSVLGNAIDNIYYKSETTLPYKAELDAENEYLLGGDAPNIAMENGLKFYVDWVRGQKTGFFVDQRENRALLERYAHGRSVLNMFCYTGGFSFYAMRGNAKLAEDAFKFLDTMGDQYDLIILDPPAFAKHKKVLNNALQGYRKLNAKAFEKIRPGGILFTFSCSQVVSKENFRLAVFSAAAQSGRNVRILHQLTQPADHPVNIYHPEGEYLKGLVLYVE